MQEILALLPRPSRYLGIEQGAVRPEEKGAVAVHCALAFPDMYEVGMSYLGQKILYDSLNSRPGVLAERVFTPCREAAAILRAHNCPLCTLESDTPLANTHLIGFSVTHELCYTNILYMLDLAGIPLYSHERGQDLSVPVIVAGGGCVMAAEPIAPFMDIMVLGDGEASLPQLCDLLAAARADNLTRAEFLQKAAHIPGVYVPSLFVPDAQGHMQAAHADMPRPTRRVVADMDEARYPASQIVPLGAVHNRLSLEIARGCTRGCRFCQAGMLYRPARERSLAKLGELMSDCLNDTGFDEVSFLSLSTGDFSALKTLFVDSFERCGSEQISVSLPSLRVGSIDDDIMRRMAGIRRTGATLAPEAGSQRLRDTINKNVTEEQLLLHVRKLADHGWQQVKLYFMIGLPGETDADIEAIVDLACKARDAAGRGKARLNITAAISPFVPKPHTPFQWEPQIATSEIERRVAWLREAFRREKMLKLRWHEPAMSSLEGLLARGGRELAPVIHKAFLSGAIFSSWVEGFSLEPWTMALAEEGLRLENYTGARALDAPLPWDHLQAGVSREFLLRERAKAFAGSLSPDCRYAACQLCGACDTKAGPSLLVAEAGATIHNRLNFAERDQAEHQPQAPQSAAVDAPPKTPAHTGKKKPVGTQAALAHKAVRFRIWHNKRGKAAYISQLELQSMLERALRRAGLPLAFSQGFHPLPLLSFGRALPVGVESRAEWFTITLCELMSAQQVRSKLEPSMLRGLEIIRVEPVPVNGSILGGANEVFALRVTKPEAQQPFLAAWQEFMAAENVLLERETKKGPRSNDIRALVQGCRYMPDASLEITCSWQTEYLSPLTLVRAVTPWLSLCDIQLVKLSQEN